MKFKRALQLLSYLLVLTPLAAAAEEQGASGAPVSLKAETLSFDVPTETYRATGSVSLQRQGVSLFADSLTYQSRTQDAVAEGRVRMERGEDLLKGDRLWLNLGSRRGELLNGDLFVKRSTFRIRGARFQKTGEQDYHLEKGSFTTCLGDNPSWHFEASDVDVTLDEYATGRNAVFYLGNVPVLYVPYLIFPVLRERSTGLLFPKFGSSSKKGVFLDQPFYWAISPSQDLTADLDLETSRGVGTAVQYRYLRARGSEGLFQGRGIYDTQQERFRGEFMQRHLELFSPTTTLISDIEFVSDRSYYKDYGETAGQYNRQLHESTVAATHRWDRYGVFGSLRYVQSLLNEQDLQSVQGTEASDSRGTMQRLPEIRFIGAGERLGRLPVFFSLDSQLVHFEREEDVTGERLELHPQLTYYARPGDVLDFAAFGGYRQRLYNTYSGDARSGQGEGEADAGATLALPLEKVYGGTLRHLLTPAVAYNYVQHRNQDRLPFFDYEDRILGQSLLSWSVSSAFTKKYVLDGEAPSYRDLLYLKLSQGYQFSGERRDLLTLVDPLHHLTDLMLEGRYTPVKELSVQFDGRYNLQDGAASTANFALEGRRDNDTSASIGYRFSREKVDYLEGRLAFPVHPFFLTALTRYSFDGGGFLESRYGVEYRHQCWSVLASYGERTGDHQFTLSFTLAGVGSLGSVKPY